MTGYILPHENLFCDPLSNGFNSKPLDDEISKNPAAYYNKLKNVFYEQKNETADSVQRVNKKSLYMLKEIKRILIKHRTKYRVILTPIYDQVKFHPKDLEILKNIFGDNLYDFTGRNNITMSKYNWYENKHFRTFVGDSLLNMIYK